MDHDYEIASYDRHRAHIFDLPTLSKPVSHYAKIRPRNYAEEQRLRMAKEAAKTLS